MYKLDQDFFTSSKKKDKKYETSNGIRRTMKNIFVINI